MSNVYVHFSQISFSTRYSVVNFQLEPHSLSFREVIIFLLPNTLHRIPISFMTKNPPEYATLNLLKLRCINQKEFY